MLQTWYYKKIPQNLSQNPLSCEIAPRDHQDLQSSDERDMHMIRSHCRYHVAWWDPHQAMWRHVATHEPCVHDTSSIQVKQLSTNQIPPRVQDKDPMAHQGPKPTPNLECTWNHLWGHISVTGRKHNTIRGTPRSDNPWTGRTDLESVHPDLSCVAP
jgi:hypothetical protein